jgi:hypothetical protein
VDTDQVQVQRRAQEARQAVDHPLRRQVAPDGRQGGHGNQIARGLAQAVDLGAVLVG